VEAGDEYLHDMHTYIVRLRSKPQLISTTIGSPPKGQMIKLFLNPSVFYIIFKFNRYPVFIVVFGSSRTIYSPASNCVRIIQLMVYYACHRFFTLTYNKLPSFLTPRKIRLLRENQFPNKFLEGTKSRPRVPETFLYRSLNDPEKYHSNHVPCVPSYVDD